MIHNIPKIVTNKVILSSELVDSSKPNNNLSPADDATNSSFRAKLYVDENETTHCKGLLDNYVLMLNDKTDKVCYEFSEVYDISEARLLGEGSFGKVFYTVNKLTNNKVAIKIAKSKYDTSLFKKEINNLKKIINICKDFICIESYGLINEKMFIAMEYLDGISLKQYITSLDAIDKSLTEKIFMEILNQLYDQVNELHHINMAHTDIKPENIMINPLTTNVRIIDLGLSCSDKICHKGGSKKYMPPNTDFSIENRQMGDYYALVLSLIELAHAGDMLDVDINYTKYSQNPRKYVKSMKFTSDKIKTALINILNKHVTDRLSAIKTKFSDAKSSLGGIYKSLFKI